MPMHFTQSSPIYIFLVKTGSCKSTWCSRECVLSIKSMLRVLREEKEEETDAELGNKDSLSPFSLHTTGRRASLSLSFSFSSLSTVSPKN